MGGPKWCQVKMPKLLFWDCLICLKLLALQISGLDFCSLCWHQEIFQWTSPKNLEKVVFFCLGGVFMPVWLFGVGAKHKLAQFCSDFLIKVIFQKFVFSSAENAISSHMQAKMATFSFAPVSGWGPRKRFSSVACWVSGLCCLGYDWWRIQSDYIQNVRVRGREAEKPDRRTDRPSMKINKDREGRNTENKIKHNEKGKTIKHDKIIWYWHSFIQFVLCLSSFLGGRVGFLFIFMFAPFDFVSTLLFLLLLLLLLLVLMM